MIVKEWVLKLDSCVLVRTVLHSFVVLNHLFPTILQISKLADGSEALVAEY